MNIDSDGNIIASTVKPLENLNEYFHKDFDEVAHDLEEDLKKGDEDEEMANLLNY
jgi:hypothetical protein